MTAIKICGVTRVEDAAAIAGAGVELLGLNFWPRSRRHVDAARARDLAAAARAAGSIEIVGVFVNHSIEDIAELARGEPLDILQLHGDESPADVSALAGATELPIWKALAARPELALADWTADAILLDTPSPDRGGTGTTFDWSIAAALRHGHAGRIVLAGGLVPDNVASAIAAVSPWAVDVASGVEASPGIKDPVKLAAFVAAVRRVSDNAHGAAR